MEPHEPKKVWTYDDLAAMPDDGRRYEIIDGELFVSPAPSIWHAEISKRIFRVLDRTLEATGVAKVYYAPVDVVLSPTRVVEPDLLVVRKERRSILKKRAVEGAPDLVIEVLSPSNTKHDRTRKRRFYARVGVPEYWIVDPDSETIDVLELIPGGLTYRTAGWYGPGDLAGSATFDLELSITELFRKDDDVPDGAE